MAAVSALVASLATLLVAMVVIDRRVVADAEAQLLDRARSLLRELEGEGEVLGPDHANDELDEYVHGGVAAVIEAHGQLIAGDDSMPRTAADGCATVSGAAERWVVCRLSGEAGARVWLGRRESELLGHRVPLLMGGGVALLVVMLGAVVAGLWMARRSLAPLQRLRRAIEAQGDDTDMQAKLPRSGLVEVDVVADSLDRTLARLHEEVERSRGFAADAAHELRTPLTKLRTELELWREESPKPEDASRLDRLLARTMSLGRLVDRLLLLASPREALQGHALVSLAACVEDVVGESAGADRIDLALDDDGAVDGDATVLTAMVSNAVDNALKYSEGRVTVTVKRDGGEVVLRVEDMGPGLSAEARARAFEPFFRAPEHRAAPGHGVGLAVIAHVAEAHGGAARFADAEVGACLEIRLPAHG
ncbi:MAG: HAMP domain-containing sensor histidine kinase [Polyangiaceae bacterium]